MSRTRYVTLETGRLVYGPLVWIDGEDVLPPEGPELAAYARRVGRVVERTWRRYPPHRPYNPRRILTV